MKRLGCAAALGVAAAVSLAHGAEPVPVMVRSAPGQFEVSAVDASAGHAVVRLGEEMWRLLSGPLNLPAGFASPIFVRVRPEKLPAPFGAAIEPGGVVSVWIQGAHGGGIPPTPVLRRALARGLLLRLAVSIRGSQDAATVPVWLELGAAGWVDTRVEPARLDALKQASQTLRPPALPALLSRVADASGEPDRADVAGAVWLFTFLQNETTAAAEWPACLAQILAGRGAGAALNEAFAGHFGSERERELWWQMGWHRLTRAQTLPSLDGASSSAELAMLTRFVFAPDDVDVVLPLRTVLEHGRDAVIDAELKRRGTQLARLVGVLHPFYRNAGLSLAACFASATAKAEERAAACARFEQDWRDAVELEAATGAALDALEQRLREGASGPAAR